LILHPDNQFKHCRTSGSGSSHISSIRLPSQTEFLLDSWKRGIKRDRFTRNFAFFQGALFVAAGCYFQQLLQLTGRCISSKYSLAVYGVTVSSLCIGLIASAMLLSAVDLWRSSSRCPHCHRRFLRKSYLTAGNRCPHCRGTLYVPEKIGRLTLPEFSFYTPAYFCFLSVPMLTCLGCVSFIGEVPRALLYTQLAWIGTGILWIAFFPLFAWYFGKYLSRCAGKKRKENSCSVCGGYYDPLILRLSGNCSVCGSQLDPDWPPPEPESPANLPRVREVRTLRQNKMDAVFGIFLIVWWIFSGVQLFLPSEHLLQMIPSLFPWGFLLIFFYILIRIFRSWKIVKPFWKCPYCHFGPFQFQKEPPEWNPQGRDVIACQYYFLRCPNCRRKLVRDDDAGKGGRHV
jgi:membrane protein